MDNTQRLRQLQSLYKDKSGEELLLPLITGDFSGRIALVSSFGIESALLLDMAARIDPAIPVIFLDTGKLFPETLHYRDELARKLGLRNIRTYYPNYINRIRSDPDGTLWKEYPNFCCYIRKVEPLARALKGFDAWITGRKQFHGGLRSSLPFFEIADGRIKINPLATWSHQQIMDEFKRRNLPVHPLAGKGYTSVGCIPCTDLPDESGNPRSGRWKNTGREECGIHLEMPSVESMEKNFMDKDGKGR